MLGNSFRQGEGEQQQRYGFPGCQTGLRNKMLEAKESLCALAAPFGKGLIENGHDQGANGNLQQAHQKHRKGCQCKRFPVRLDVS